MSFAGAPRGNRSSAPKVAFDFFGLILNKMTQGLFPTRFALFATVGLSGVGIHLCVLYLLLFIKGIEFVYAQAAATAVAMTSNFFINNLVTYRDVKLQRGEFLVGLLRFYLVCSAGALANVGIATLIYEQFPHWVFASVAGVVMGSVWNYALSSLYVWSERS
jgi:dolichol-phosphate mannosyltransferase